RCRKPPRRRPARRGTGGKRRAASSRVQFHAQPQLAGTGLDGDGHAGGAVRRPRPPLRPARHAVRAPGRADAPADLPRSPGRPSRPRPRRLDRMTTPLLAAHGLAFARNELPVFGPLDFAVDPGEALLVQGGNGTGKTTLLRVLAGL